MKTAAERGCGFELGDLLHPAQAFAHPSNIIGDPDLTVSEKRAILVSWAADARAAGAAPVVSEAIVKALRALDQLADPATIDTRFRDWCRRQARRRSIERFRQRRGDDADRGNGRAAQRVRR